MRTVRWILFALVLLLFGVIVFRNLEATAVELIFVTLELPLAALLTLTLLLGWALGLSTPALLRVRAWRTSRGKPKTGFSEKRSSNKASQSSVDQSAST